MCTHTCATLCAQIHCTQSSLFLLGWITYLSPPPVLGHRRILLHSASNVGAGDLNADPCTARTLPTRATASASLVLILLPLSPFPLPLSLHYSLVVYQHPFQGPRCSEYCRNQSGPVYWRDRPGAKKALFLCSHSTSEFHTRCFIPVIHRD